MRNHIESAKIFSAFCDETRLKVLEQLRKGKKSAGALLKDVNVGQSTLSHHMKILVESGIVKAKKSGKWTYYSICEKGRKYAAELLIQLTNFQLSENVDASLPNIFSYKIKENTMNSYTIMVDTSCDLPVEFAEEHGIESLPITFTLDDEAHNDGYWQKISGKAFYNALREGSVAKTAQVNPDTFLEVFSAYADKGEDLLLITLSSGLSGTYQSTQIALKDIKESYPDCNIYAVDSLSASVGVAMLTMMAVIKRKEGLSVEETAKWLEEKKHSILGLFTVDDLMYLHRGGRLSKLSAVAGTVLGIRPLLNLQPDGTLKLKGKAHGRKGALSSLIEQFKRSIAPDGILDTVCIAHTDCESDALSLAEMVKQTTNIGNVIVLMMGPVIGAHVGPGTIVLLFESNMTRAEYEEKF